MAFKQAYRHRGCILEQVAHPRERVGVEGKSCSPYRSTTRGIAEAHVGTAAAARTFFITPLEVFQFLDGLVDQVIEAISKAANTGKIGDVKIFVMALEQAIRIRTGETGEDAV